jgi:hypothetical protein
MHPQRPSLSVSLALILLVLAAVAPRAAEAYERRLHPRDPNFKKPAQPKQAEPKPRVKVPGNDASRPTEEEMQRRRATKHGRPVPERQHDAIRRMGHARKRVADEAARVHAARNAAKDETSKKAEEVDSEIAAMQARIDALKQERARLRPTDEL